MSRGLGDLIPIFLAEARERLEAMRGHARLAADRPEALEEVRRQLHGLKGAARMLGLEKLAALCHRGEDLVTGNSSVSPENLLAIVDQLQALTDELEAGSGGTEGARRTGTPPAAAPRSSRPAPRREGVIGVPAKVLDEATERAIRLRLLTSAESAGIEEIFDLSRFAEAGVADREPRQVLATLAISLRQLAMELDRTHRPVLELLRQHQEELVRVHRQPLAPHLRRLARHAGELADSLGKSVRVTVTCGSVTLDRRLMAALEEPILHLVRNALDHGIEPPEEREAAGKPVPGTLEIGARGEGALVYLWVRDDGRGLDPERIARRAVELGLLEAESRASVPDAELLNVVFRPGFSTAGTVTEISGRGIGLDAVAAVVHRLGGRVRVMGAPGRGTTVELQLPAVRRGERVLVLAAGGMQAAVTAGHVQGFVQLSRCELSSEDGTETATFQGRKVRFHRLTGLFGEGGGEAEGTLVLLSAGESEVGLAVDRPLGEEDVMLRPFPALAGSHPVFESVTLLASGLPVPVISSRLLATLRPGEIPALGASGGSRRLRILVVDDSRVTREMIRRVLESGGCKVMAVRSAEEALLRLRDQRWDCLVTDVEMPGINGLELTRKLREIPELRHLPVVLVSTRGLPEDRLAGLEAGADAYLTKQGLTSRELVQLVRRLGGGS